MKNLGLYLHIPFCKSKCLYCDFCSFPNPKEEQIASYVGALCHDLERRSRDCHDYEVDTVYLGGGTPTILRADQLEQIMETLTRYYHISATAEITAECNPATGGAELFRRMRSVGFNRLSIGLQSANCEELRALGRLHTFEQFLETWESARSAGFSNLSADVMFGIPHQTRESFLATLDKVLSCNPTHLSAYALAVEEGTPFGKRGEDALHLPDEESTRSMYLDMVSRLNGAGLRQYEISNFARVGYESRHNLKYWNMDAYLGFGPAAYSDFEGVRFGNGRGAEAYIRGEEIVAEYETPSETERMNEYVMLRMRLTEGISLPKLRARFGEASAGRIQKSLASYETGGFVRKTENGFAFTPKGFLVSNTVLSEVLDFGEGNA